MLSFGPPNQFYVGDRFILRCLQHLSSLQSHIDSDENGDSFQPFFWWGGVGANLSTMIDLNALCFFFHSSVVNDGHDVNYRLLLQLLPARVPSELNHSTFVGRHPVNRSLVCLGLPTIRLTHYLRVPFFLPLTSDGVLKLLFFIGP